MEEFRKKLIRNVRLYWLFVIFSVIGIISLTIFSAKNHSNSGFSGFFGAFIGVSAINLHKNRKALRNEKLFKEMYIRNTDERTVAIEREASKAAFYIMMIAVSIGMIAFTYLNQAVSYTLACVLGVMTIIYLGTHIYYNKKM
jgi:uncharacterized membrane protein